MNDCSLQNIFLDSFHQHNTVDEISYVLAQNILGISQLSKILLRFSDLKNNFDSYTYDEYVDNGFTPVWKFSSGVTPYMDYDDTTSVPIPITHPIFKDFSKECIISLDFPLWFNISNATKVIMFISQDPMPRSKDFYEKCSDAICSTTFGLHSPTWRRKHNGGMRMWSLICNLIKKGYGVYVTDCYKYYFFKKSKSNLINQQFINQYTKTLIDELTIIKPSLVVTLGKKPFNALKNIGDNISLPKVCALPHFSGRAQKTIKKYFNIHNQCSIFEQVELYTNEIINNITT